MTNIIAIERIRLFNSTLKSSMEYKDKELTDVISCANKYIEIITGSGRISYRHMLIIINQTDLYRVEKKIPVRVPNLNIIPVLGKRNVKTINI